VATSAIMIPGEKVAAFCRRHRIRRQLLFGPALCDDFRPDSAIDLLAGEEPGRRIGFISRSVR
jgi:predicted nucleotidyltransferase